MGFREYLNEASTISALGATKEQIKVVYSKISEYRSTVVVDAKAKFVQKSKKKEVTDLMRSENVDQAVVVGFNGTMMYYTVQTKFKNYDSKKDEYVTYQVDQFGNLIAQWIEQSAIKALSYYKGVKTYNIAEKGATRAQRKEDHGIIDDENGEEVAYNFAKLIEKDMEKLFIEAKAQFTRNITKTIEAGDLLKAREMLSRLVIDKGQWHGGFVEKQFSDFLRDGWNNNTILQQIKNTLADKNGTSTSGFGWIPAVNYLTATSSTKDIRQAAADVLKITKEKINDIIKG
jgi:hypothetical protein